MATQLAIAATPVSLSARPSRAEKQSGSASTGKQDNAMSPRKAPDPRLSGSQVDALLKECLQRNRTGIEEAFQSVDPDNEGNINTSDFERVIDHFFFPLSKDQHVQLVDRVGLNLDGAIDYDRFLEFLSGRPAPVQLNPQKKAERAMKRPLPQQLSEEDVENRIRYAISKKGDRLLRAFQMHDRTGGLGRMRKDDFCQVINSFVMVLTSEQFERLWEAYDVERDGFISFEPFMKEIMSRGGQRINATSAKGVKAKVDRSGLKEVGQKLIADPKAVPLQHVEQQLRNLMKRKCPQLQEKLRQASERKDGFVTVQQLKSSLDSVLMPVSDRVFEAILMSVGLTTSVESLPFEDFIRRFMANEERTVLAEAVTEKVSGSDGHVVGPDKGMDIETIMMILRRDIPAGSAALLAKFIKHDSDRTGQVSAFELRNVLGAYGVNLPESGFRCLMEQLDPRGRGMLRYSEFLEFFTPKVPEGKKKWLDEVNYYNRARPAVDMTFKQFKNQLQDKMRAKGKPLSELFLEIDTNKDGIISPQELRVFLEENYLESSDENFNRLWKTCDLNEDGYIQFSEFLSTMGLEINPGDVGGVSQRITGANQSDGAKRRDDQKKRMQKISVKSGEEAKANNQLWQRAQRTMKQRSESGHLQHAFEAFDSDHDGQLSHDELAEMLQHMKIVQDDVIMDSVLGSIPGNTVTVEMIPHLFNSNPFETGAMSPHQERPKAKKSARPPAGASNRARDETPLLFKRDAKKQAMSIHGQGPKVMLTAQEMADRLREMVQLKFIDMHTAFRKFDANLDGYINRKEFQKVLVDFHFNLDKAELEKLLTHIGMKADEAQLEYEGFLKFFGANEGSDAHSYLNSTHRYNIAHPPRSISAEQAARVLPLKVADAFRTVREAYKAVDQNAGDCVKRSGLRSLLERFNIPMIDVEFEKLWRRFDTNNDGELQVDEFFASLGLEVTSTDTGASQLIAEESDVQEKQHRDDQEDKMQAISQKHQQAVKRMPVKQIGDQVQWKMEQERRTLGQIARHADVNDDRVLSRAELLQILQNRGFDIDQNKLEKVLGMIGLDHLAEVPYRDFMDAFADTKHQQPGEEDASIEDEEVMMYTGSGQAAPRTASNRSIMKRPAAPTPSSHPRLRMTAVHEDMTLNEFLPLIMQQVLQQQDRFREQLLRADKGRTGLIETRLLKSALTAHCGVKLTAKQVQVLIEHGRCVHGGKVSYNHLLDYLGLPVCEETAGKLSHYEPQRGAAQRSRGPSPQSPAPGEKLRLPLITQSAPVGDVLPRPVGSKASAVRDSQMKLPSIQEVPSQSQPADKLQSIFHIIRQQAQSRVREMTRDFKRLDPRRSGTVSVRDFRDLLKRYGVELSSHQMFRLQDAFDSGEASLKQSALCYGAFMAACFRNS